MRFYPGIRFGRRRPRGRGRGDPPYRLSRAAYQARLRNVSRVKRRRSYHETRRLELEIALGWHRGETYRALAKRLGLRSHAHCWRVARRYRLGLLRFLPRNEQGLVKLRDSLYGEVPQRAAPWWMAHEWRSRDEIWGSIVLTQEQKTQATAEFDRREYAKQHGAANETTADRTIQS